MSPTGAAAPTELLSVSPPGGATGVSPTASIVVRFSNAMHGGMEQYFSLHQNGIAGQAIACTASWSGDRMTLTLMPAMPLPAATQFTLHVGGGIMDADGNVIDMMQNGSMMGGQWATGSMMIGGGMMNGGEMGPGWMGTNGMYGMVFVFTTS
jgi:hypothetical protein